MPSWNVHTAHVEKLLREHDAHELGIVDANSFLFGNYAPDIYVGYMVPNPTKKIAYRTTHFADAAFIPAPHSEKFWNLYIEGKGRVSDVVLGAWCHLVADHYYNLNTRTYIDSIGVKPGDQTRIRKQGDFDKFGRTLSISLVAHVTPQLVRECAEFPQYSIDEPDVHAAVKAADDIVLNNTLHHIEGTPDYSLLTPKFFSDTFDEVNERLVRGLRQYAASLEENA